MTRVVVVGANGFIGSAIASEVAEKPELHIVRAVREPSAGEELADLTRPHTLETLICPGDVVVNCAGYANAIDSTESGKRRLDEVNVRGVEALARACASNGARQLVHLSSVAAMGPWSGEGIDEDDLRPPASPYGASKLRAEQTLQAFGNSLAVTILRPTSIFGEGRGLARSLCRLVSLPVVPLPGGGSASIPFCYVKNVSDAVFLSLGNPNCFGKTFIVGDERSYSLREVVEEFARALGKDPFLLPIPSTLVRAAVALESKLASARDRIPALGEERFASLMRSVSYSIDRFRRATGYQPRYDLAAAARRIAHWYEAEVAR